MTVVSRQSTAVAESIFHTESATPDLFRLGMRRLASGIALVTTVYEGRPAGFVATSVTGVSAEPPSLLVCANQTVSAHNPIDRAGHFCVSMLGERDETIAAQFSSSDRRAERFTGGDWGTLSSGSPVLRSAMSWFDCEIEARIRHHSHSIFLARITEIGIGEQQMPLIYFDQRYLELKY